MTDAELRLADELTYELNDERSKAYHRRIVQIYNHQFLRETKREVLSKDNVKNKGAYFNTLVQVNGEKYKIR